MKLYEFYLRKKGTEIMLSNVCLAFTVCALAYIIGEWVSTATRAWVPSVFVTAVIMLLGYWTIFPKDLITNAGLIPLQILSVSFFSDYPYGYGNQLKATDRTVENRCNLSCRSCRYVRAGLLCRRYAHR